MFGSLGLEGAFVEDTPYAPNSPYSASKAASDHLAHAWHCTYGLPVLIANSCNNYGPYQFPEKLIPLIVPNAIVGRPLPVYGDGKNVRDWLYVEDNARALIAIVERGKPGARYNVGARSERSNLAVVHAICDYLDEKLPLSTGRLLSRGNRVRNRSGPGHDLRYAINPERIESEIGWRPQESFDAGLELTIDWYLANEPWWRAIRERRYDGERLGLVRKFA